MIGACIGGVRRIDSLRFMFIANERGACASTIAAYAQKFATLPIIDAQVKYEHGAAMPPPPLASRRCPLKRWDGTCVSALCTLPSVRPSARPLNGVPFPHSCGWRPPSLPPSFATGLELTAPRGSTRLQWWHFLLRGSLYVLIAADKAQHLHRDKAETFKNRVQSPVGCREGYSGAKLV